MKRQLTYWIGAVALTAGGWLSLHGLPTTVRAETPVASEPTKAQIATMQDLSNVFKTVGKTVEPSVVNINVRKSVKAPRRGIPDDLLKKFFPDRNQDGQPDLPPGMGEGDGNDGPPLEQFGTGSGVIMEVTNNVGYILTNNHVAGGATEMDVTLADGREIKNATLVGADPKTDLAVVKIESPNLVSATWGNSDELEKGDWVMAFGSPFGFVGSMTHGIVSALHRNRVGILGQYGYENFIQVDAPINPGNSGGPLVNIRSEVVGINTAILSRSGGFQGIGFAIPSNQAKPIFKLLKEKGRIVRGWLGVEIADVAKLQAEARSSGYEGNSGVLVKGVLNGAPAAGKLKAGDVIVALNGKNVENVEQLRNAIALIAPDTSITLSTYREGKAREVELKLGEQPGDAQVATSGGGSDVTQTLGMRLGDLDQAVSEKYNLGDQKGAVVLQLAPTSVAAQAGVRPGDVITRVGKVDVTDAVSARDAFAKADLKKGIRVFIVNADGSKFVFLQSDK